MESVQLLFENSPWWIAACLAAGVLYALLLYIQKNHFKHESWGKKINYTLLALRFLLVSLLCFLIVGPFVKQTRHTVESPVVVFAVDNSSSVAAVMDSSAIDVLKQQVDSIATALRKVGYSSEIRDLQTFVTLDSLEFDNPSTNLDDMLRTIASNYEGRNIASVVLLSDGIYNQGVSPTYRPYNFTVNAVGLGDTVPKQDLSVRNLFYNKIAYQGNKFPIVAEVLNTGFAGEKLSVSVSRRGRILATQEITPANRRDVNSVEFLLEADQEGMQHYVLTVAQQAGEFTTQNNEAHAYVEVVEGKENILLLAQSPHPDIKALRSAIESNKNYELTSVVLSTDEIDRKPLKGKKFDLLIMHQLPGRDALPITVSPYLQSAKAVWYIIGSQTDLSAFNRANTVAEIASVGNETDEVSAVYDNAFSGFQLENDTRSVIEELLPLRVPFGDVILKHGAVPVLNQRVGNVKTSKPLLVVGESDGKKSAVLLAEGIWKWRQQEYARYEKTVAFDALFTKLTQYLSAKEDKRQFKVYPLKNEFEDTEPVVFDTEIYDEVYDEVYGQSVKLSIATEDSTQREYSYVTNESNTQYRISNLPEGIYQYTASVNLKGTRLVSKGEFTVRSLQIETLNLTANHDLLRDLSDENGGKFFNSAEISDLVATLSTQQATGKIYTSELFLPLVNLKWLFFVLLILVVIEWGIRKYMGSY